MNLYDEALSKALWIKFNKDIEVDEIIKALERAKKVEKELKYTKEQFDKYWKEVCILKPKLSKVEGLLGLYKELSFIRKFEYRKQQPSDTEIMCMNEIQLLEEKLK